MEIKMKETTKGSPNGKIVNEYIKGENYELNEELANVFIKMGVGEVSKSPIAKKENIEEKALYIPSNKSAYDFDKKKNKKDK